MKSASWEEGRGPSLSFVESIVRLLFLFQSTEQKHLCKAVFKARRRSEEMAINFLSRAYKLSIMIARYIVRDYFVDS